MLGTGVANPVGFEISVNRRDWVNAKRYWEKRMLTARSFRFLTLCLMVGSLGCGAISKRPDPEWVADFDIADTLVLRRKDTAPIKITESATIKRFRSIYQESKWTPYWHTLPGNLGDRTIEIYDGDVRLRTFSYDGTLWESDSYTENRTAELDDDDRQWISSLFESD